MVFTTAVQFRLFTLTNTKHLAAFFFFPAAQIPLEWQFLALCYSETHLKTAASLGLENLCVPVCRLAAAQLQQGRAVYLFQVTV